MSATASASATRPPTGACARTTAAGRAALDVLLTDAAVSSGLRRFVNPGAAAAVTVGLARHPDRAIRRVTGLGGELARVAAGRSERPGIGDRRFADPAWETNWLLRRLLQAYLAAGGTLDGLISDAETDWRTERQARFAAANLLDALAPTNFPWSNPAVLKDIVDHGGAGLARGMRQLLRDLSHPPRLPASVDTAEFTVGENLAVTPGAVVLRTDVFELIQYQPRGERVREVPLLVVPPTINKYYVLDLAPGRSLVEHLLGEGQQIFMISWRNPDVEQGHFDLDTYVSAVLQARDAVAEIARRPSVHVAAACSGGIVSSCALAHLAAEGRLLDVASLTLLVCALDNAQAGTVSALTSRELAAAAIAESARKGYLDGQALAGVFAWLRPNDLIWTYWINNYLLGRRPPAFDVLYWNQDTVRLSAGLHRDFVRIALGNLLAKAGAVTALGTPVDLGKVDVDAYVVAGLNDHIVPWENAHRSGLLLGGDTRFVLSTSGHIQALINPPGPKSRASYHVCEDRRPGGEDWLEHAATERGSWWPDYVRWLAARSGELKPAKKTLGSRRHKALARAPGSYVHAG